MANTSDVEADQTASCISGWDADVLEVRLGLVKDSTYRARLEFRLSCAEV